MVTPCILSQEAARKDTLPKVRKITEKKDVMRFRKQRLHLQEVEGIPG